MELLLVKDDLFEVVTTQKPAEPPAGWTTRDGKARATIGLALDNDQLCHVMGAATAYDMWNSLKGYHERGSLTNKIYVFRKLCSLKLAEGGNMAQHLMEVAELVHRLVALGEGLQEHWIVAIILSSLPASYDALITALESRPVEELKQDYVKGKLLDEWKRKSENMDSDMADDKALKAAVRGRGARTKGESYDKNEKRKKKCYCCQQLGHFWRDCPKLHVSDDEDEEEAKVSMARKTRQQIHDERNICFAATGGREQSANKIKEEEWCLDSGCTLHLTGKAELLKGLVACDKKIVLADGRNISATAVGTGMLKVTKKDGTQNMVKIEKVFFVPGLARNLLSVRRIAEKGFSVQFSSNVCVIKKEGSITVVGKKQNGLYVIQ